MTKNEIEKTMDKEFFSCTIEVTKTPIKEFYSEVCWTDVTTLDEFEGMFLAMTSKQLKKLESIISIPIMAC